MSSSSLRISVDSDGRVVLGEEVVEKLSVLRKQQEFTEEQVAFILSEAVYYLQGQSNKGSMTKPLLIRGKQRIICYIAGDSILVKNNGSFHFAFEPTPSTKRSWKDYTGEFYWISPEQLNRENYNSHPTQEAIWSLGILALELAEKPPYFDQLPKKAFEFLTNIVLPPPSLSSPKWSGKFRDFISKVLVKDPKARATLDEIKEHPFLNVSIKDASSLFNSEDGDTESSLSKSESGDINGPDEYNWDRDTIRRGDSFSNNQFDLDSLAMKMKDKMKGVPVSDRMWRLKMYPCCFIGREAVDWLMKEFQLNDRSEAVSIGQVMMYRGIFYHVVHSEPFADRLFFYRFKDHDSMMRRKNRTKVRAPTFITNKLPVFAIDENDKITDPETGVKVMNRRYHFKTYDMCFIGSEAVDWLVKEFQLSSRIKALELGQVMMDRGIFHHVVNAHKFEDKYLFYRFYMHEKGKYRTDFVIKPVQTSSSYDKEKWKNSRKFNEIDQENEKLKLITELTQHIIKKKSATAEEFAWLESLVLDGMETENTMLNACKAIAAITFPEEVHVGLRNQVLESKVFNALLFYAASGLISVHNEIPFQEVEIGEKIASGASGVVYQAKWHDKNVAVKIYNPEHISFSIEEFRTELAIMSMLRHENLVVCYGACTKEPNLFIVTELLTSNINQLLRKGTLNYDVLRYIAIEMVKPTMYLHRIGIIHRDLKTANFLIGENVKVKLTDFGISTIQDPSFQLSGSVGTPPYIAPEVFSLQNGERYNEKADVYSFAIILWELITQKEPWGDVKTFEIPELVCKGERPKIPDNCPPEWAKLIHFCWLQSPSDRPTFLQILSYLEKMEKEESKRIRSLSKLKI